MAVCNTLTSRRTVRLPKTPSQMLKRPARVVYKRTRIDRLNGLYCRLTRVHEYANGLCVVCKKPANVR